ncbi:MAG: DEAD/DEAH box helicase [Lachnospiraceae bacterium]
MYISDIIKTDIMKWKPKDTVFISAPTGTGKTTFVLEQLLPYAINNEKRILYLCNRSVLEQQLKAKLFKRQGIDTYNAELIKSTYDFEGISIMTYQRLQSLKGNALQEIENDFSYIIYDEIHYLMEDAAFNAYTSKLWKFISCRCISIFMSATLDDLPERIINKMYDEYVDERLNWEVENKFLRKKKIIMPLCQTMIHNLVNGLNYGDGDIPYNHVWYYDVPEQEKNIMVKYYEDEEMIIKEIIDNQKNTDDKWLLFTNNKKRGALLCASLKKSNISTEMFSADDRESDIRKEIINQEAFETRVLITTKVLDNGITLKDCKLKHIMIDTISETEFLQMLGRKRYINQKDKFILYICKKSAKQFSGYKNLECKKNIDFLTKAHTNAEICDESKKSKEYDEMVKKFMYVDKDGKFVINEWALVYYKKQYEFVCRMEEAVQKDEWAFVKEQLSWLGMEKQFDENNALERAVADECKEELSEYLTSLRDKSLDKEEQKEFRKSVKNYAIKMKKEICKNSRTPGLKVINQFFKESELPFFIESGERGGSTKWQIKSRLESVKL